MNRQEVNNEVQQYFGAVPGFISAVPNELIGPMWEHMRDLQLKEGKIPPKYQQLIMLGVSAVTKCRYCIDFHTEIAKVLGATQAELTEAVILAGHTTEWSSYINGTQYDFATFQREVRAACQHAAQMMATGKGAPAGNVGAQARKHI